MNTVNLYGRVCQDLELTKGKGKDAWKYVRFNVAVADGKDDDGEKRTQFIPCIAWNTTAQTLIDYVQKGDRIALRGRLNIQKYDASLDPSDDHDPDWRTSVQVVVETFDFVESAADKEDKPVSNPKRKR